MHNMTNAQTTQNANYNEAGKAKQGKPSRDRKQQREQKRQF